jgi:hypothetical protein
MAGFRAGGWAGRIRDRQAVAKVTLDEALATEALLLGRRTYEWLAARWRPAGCGAATARGSWEGSGGLVATIPGQGELIWAS